MFALKHSFLTHSFTKNQSNRPAGLLPYSLHASLYQNAFTSPAPELKIYNVEARRRAFKTKNIFIEDKNYE